ncbi:MAG TPA: DUF6351 family protein [Mycobacteriales bacterium]|nr:DUF6351 family protein [Mycobacteriales bacterium]
MTRRWRYAAVAALVCAAIVPMTPAALAAHPGQLRIEVLSTRADLVSGGVALVAVDLPAGVKSSSVRVHVGRRDVTHEFAVRPNRRFEALVTGLKNGRNELIATARGARGARLTVTSHPLGGPVFAGPQLPAWQCEPGAVDAKCDKPATFTYLYRSSDPTKAGLQAYDPKHPASDVASTTTDTGVTVPFIVREETDYQDRDQVVYLTLFQPGKRWSRWSPQPQFAHKLLVTHGGGCGASHGTGSAPLDDFSGTIPTVPGITESYITALGKGFGVMSTALDNNGHNCNGVLQAESLIMAKEHFIDQYGDVKYTIGTGCSGGSIAQQQVANAYPGGVYNGLIVTCAFPDDFSTAGEFADYHLLRIYFENPAKWGTGIVWTPAQWAAVEGRPDPVNAIVADEAFFKSATNPSGSCAGKRTYNPKTKPAGVRCSVIDAAINVFGRQPRREWDKQEKAAGHGFAGLPLGNAGILYGLDALEQGLITADQFIDLNAKVGGLNIDGGWQAARTRGDKASIRAAYRSGLINEANNMDDVAIIDAAGPDPGAAHDYVHTWWMRDRIERALGGTGNHVLWYGPTPLVGDVNWMNVALEKMDSWLAAVNRDHSSKPVSEKVLADRPASVHNRCEYPPDVAPPLDTAPTDGICLPPLVQTRYQTPRQVAGEDEANDIVACHLRPLLRYQLPNGLFTDAQWSRLTKIFPNGVCNWDVPGIGQQDTIPWQTYQNARGHVIYGGRPLGPAPRSTPLD